MVLAEKLGEYFKGELAGKTIAVWGLSFKPKTDDIREAPAIAIIEYLCNKGAEIKAFDPEAMENAKRRLTDIEQVITYCGDMYSALANSDALIIATEWHKFRNPDFEKIKGMLKKPVIFDGRRLYDPKKMEELGFDYYSIGGPAISQKEVP